MATLKVWRDDSTDSPRDDDNMGTMVCFHKRYTLGDKHDYRADDYNGWDDVEKTLLETDFAGGVSLPLYLYDHSGITMNTTGFSCQWDSGQVGVIFASAAKIRENFMVKRITKKIRERALALLVSEVSVYDQFIRGDVYGYTITDDDGSHIDSCGGFYGDDPKENGMLDNSPAEYASLFTAISFP
jgi:hypothetical protein